jgi:Arc/MetJ-type ribon-helix-helix transcriptional regulator
MIFDMTTPEAEKITINMNVVDLGRVDLLVSEGFYSNRTDFIRTAIRNQLDRHREVLDSTVRRRELAMGVLMYTRRDLEELKEEGNQLNIAITGLLVLTKDITPELAREVIQSIRVVGVFRASDAVKQALADRTR